VCARYASMGRSVKGELVAAQVGTIASVCYESPAPQEQEISVPMRLPIDLLCSTPL
jgi:hypothetical protein